MYIIVVQCVIVPLKRLLMCLLPRLFLLGPIVLPPVVERSSHVDLRSLHGRLPMYLPVYCISRRERAVRYLNHHATKGTAVGRSGVRAGGHAGRHAGSLTIHRLHARHHVCTVRKRDESISFRLVVPALTDDLRLAEAPELLKRLR